MEDPILLNTNLFIVSCVMSIRWRKCKGCINKKQESENIGGQNSVCGHVLSSVAFHANTRGILNTQKTQQHSLSDRVLIIRHNIVAF